jgi:BirA family biotin operon repressor/biotin-[acetyl-CoA-carboxylase] ligase
VDTTGNPGFNWQQFETAYRKAQLCLAETFHIAEIPGEPTVPAMHIFDTVASTNQVAWELLEQGAEAGTCVLATQQTGGKGQWGRQWSSPVGGLYLSLLLTPDLPVENAAQLTLSSVWGVAHCLRSLPGKLRGADEQIPVQVKWLNDLVLERRKLGGILTETRLSQGRITRAVVGVGVNWANPVPPIGISLRPYLELQQSTLIDSLEMLAGLTLHGLMLGYQCWRQQGIEGLLPSYLEMLAHRDRPIRVDGRTGTIVGITPQAELRVRFHSEPPQPINPPGISSADASVEVLLKPGTISLGYGE